MNQTISNQKYPPSVSRAFGAYFSRFICALAFMGLFSPIAMGQYIPDPNFAAAIRADYPTSIDANNNLTAAAATVTSLNVAVRNIVSLNGIDGFTNLQTLKCNDNQLISLPPLPNTLQTLRCAFNQLTSLPTLPNSLQLLDCDNNRLLNLPTLPNSLQFLDCHNNQVTNLPTLPNSLQLLDCLNNHLAALPTLPAGLQRLNCTANELTSLPTLPNTLTDLFCASNQLTSLPTLPVSLQILRCYRNLITCLPTLPNTLTILQVDDNRVSCLPNYPPNFVVSNSSFVPITLPLCSLSTPSVTNVLCNGNSTGKIVMTATGGIGAITYSISPNIGTQSPAGTFNNLTAGIYTLTATDANNCTKATTVTITEPSALVVNVANNCQLAYYGYGSSCKTLAVTVSGGTGNYTYQWSGSSQTSASIQVCPTITTNYTVTVTDQNGCSTTQTLSIVVVDVRCGNNNDKVLVCHNGFPICVSSNAVAAHLAHGDKLGNCNAVGCGTIQAQNVSSNTISEAYAAAEVGRNRIQFLTNQGFPADYFEVEKQNAITDDFEHSAIQTVKRLASAAFTIFPNPATEEAFIDLKSFDGRAVSIVISDISGKTIQQTQVPQATATPYRLDLTTIETGLYLVKIEAKGKRLAMLKLQITK